MLPSLAQTALPSLLSFFAGARVTALAASSGLALLLSKWLVMPLGFGAHAPAKHELPPHLSGEFASFGTAALLVRSIRGVVPGRVRNSLLRPTQAAPPRKGQRRPPAAARVADESDSDSDDEATPEVPCRPAVNDDADTVQLSDSAAAWERDFCTALGSLACVPVRPEERGRALGSPAGVSPVAPPPPPPASPCLLRIWHSPQVLLRHLLEAPAIILSPVEAIVRAAVRRAAGSDWDSPYSRLLLFSEWFGGSLLDIHIFA